MTDDYNYPLALTSQFRFCGNPFRLDFYSFCSFGCKYCFARTINGQDDFKMSYAKFDIIDKLFKKAFDNNDDSKDINVELLRHKVPIHVGGLADPFQPAEWRLKLNYKLIELSNKYKYPLIFSTKTGYLPDEYWSILDPELHAFQISLIGLSDDYIRRYEDNTATATQRLEFLKQLRSRGFWCSIRIQPVIDMTEVLKLCKVIDGVASYVTIEHLKIDITSDEKKELFKNEIMSGEYKPTSKMKDLELNRQAKIDNILKIKEVLKNTKVGVGDNDLHFLSQSRCCCGVDTINSNFDNYLKYNLTYFATESLGKKIADDDSIWIPQNSVSSCVDPHIRIKNGKYKDYVHNYCSLYNEFMCDGCSMKTKTDGIIINRDNGRQLRQVSLFNMDDLDD